MKRSQIAYPSTAPFHLRSRKTFFLGKFGRLFVILQLQLLHIHLTRLKNTEDDPTVYIIIP